MFVIIDIIFTVRQNGFPTKWVSSEMGFRPNGFPAKMSLCKSICGESVLMRVCAVCHFGLQEGSVDAGPPAAALVLAFSSTHVHGKNGILAQIASIACRLQSTCTWHPLTACVAHASGSVGMTPISTRHVSSSCISGIPQSRCWHRLLLCIRKGSL